MGDQQCGTGQISHLSASDLIEIALISKLNVREVHLVNRYLTDFVLRGDGIVNREISDVSWELLMKSIEAFEVKTQDIVRDDGDMVRQGVKMLVLFTKSEALKDGIGYQELQEREKRGEIFRGDIFNRLARHLYLLEKLERQNTAEKYRLAALVAACMSGEYYFSADRETVRKICELGCKCKGMDGDWLFANESLKQVIDSAKYLKSSGIPVSVFKGEVLVDDAAVQQIFKRLEEKISKVGGIHLLEKVLKEQVNGRYCTMIGRFILGRNFDHSRNQPVNLLMQLAAKHLIPGGYMSEREKEQELETIIHIAQSWLDMCEIQVDSSVEYAMMDISSLPWYMNNEMIFDKFSKPVQYSKQFVLTLLDGLIKPWFNRYAGREYSYKEYYRVAKGMFSLENPAGDLEQKQLKKHSGITAYKLQKILQDISISSGEINQSFTALDEPTNLFIRPLIKIMDGRYIYLPQEFSGIGFYYAAYDMIKSNYNLLDRELGEKIESVLVREMDKKGFNCMRGKYLAQGGVQEGECDLVLQGKRTFFFEIKKRSSEREFDRIDDVALLDSLAAGMVRAQVQAFQHERYLKKNGKMTLDDKGKIYTVLPGEENLPAVKISICLPEYSYLTDKIFSRNLIEVLLRGEFKAHDPSRQKKLDKLNQYGKKLCACVKDMDIKEGVGAREIASFSLFSSLQQVLTAVWHCDNQDDFFEVIRRWAYSTDKTLDPYITLAMFLIEKQNGIEKSVRKSAIDMLERSHPYAMFLSL